MPACCCQTRCPWPSKCRVVLPPDVELETRTRRFSEEPERFGNDCDAWAQWVRERPKALGLARLRPLGSHR